MAVETNVPVVDIGPFRDGSAGEKRRLAATVGETCEAHGVLVVSGHGVPQDLIDEAFRASDTFFGLPATEKRRFTPADPAIPRDYTAFASKSLGRTLGLDTPPDLREQFYIGPAAPDLERLARFPEAARFYEPNVWPDEPADYRRVYSELYREMEALGAVMMRLFAVALDLDEDFFDDKIDNHFSTLPANYYPALDGAPAPDQIRAGPHTDFGSLTLLAIEGEASGLQVQLGDGAWHDVARPAGSLVVNLGDMMARWTNDRWRSTLHRVVNPVQAGWGTRRQSIAYFLHPNYDAEIACLDSCADAARPPRYAPILAGAHMAEKMERRVAY
ncbi:MAG: 2-oxoglutarate and iron-dependent oxygenase domain-containing protein [Alphaproteobacteria bacterium]|jgi:isopenicillin N synthase-like dioxygenase|nr:2-oxoglutarate and iron-dependent oxygenase domain-containing protein [Alphaproteobacteria bacterium]